MEHSLWIWTAVVAGNITAKMLFGFPTCSLDFHFYNFKITKSFAQTVKISLKQLSAQPNCYWCGKDQLTTRCWKAVTAFLSSQRCCALLCQGAAQPDGVCVVGAADRSGSGLKRRLHCVFSCGSAQCQRSHFQPSQRMGPHSQVPREDWRRFCFNRAPRRLLTWVWCFWRKILLTCVVCNICKDN